MASFALDWPLLGKGHRLNDFTGRVLCLNFRPRNSGLVLSGRVFFDCVSA